MDDYNKIAESEKGLMEKILTVFPGYKGYRKKEVLRETDKLVRDTIFNDLRKSKERFRSVCSDLSREGKIDNKDSERILMRIDTIAEKIHHATYGYSPEMNVISIKEDHIKRLIAFDQNLANNVKEMRESIDQLKNSEDIKKLLSNVNDCTVSLEETFSERKNYMSDLSGV